MASSTFEHILHEVEQLSRAEQQLLLDMLKQRADTAPSAIAALLERETQRTPLTNERRAELDAWFARVDVIAEQVSARWKDPSISAVDAVREQRQD